MDRSANMRAIRSKGMKPELALRSLVHSLGYRFRLHGRYLPGKPDLVFAGRRKVIFMHGCFWHQHGSSFCRLNHQPRSNRSYWQAKLDKNKERDAAHCEALRAAGWDVLIVWECELRNARLEDRVTTFLSGSPRRSARGFESRVA